MTRSPARRSCLDGCWHACRSRRATLTLQDPTYGPPPHVLHLHLLCCARCMQVGFYVTRRVQNQGGTGHPYVIVATTVRTADTSSKDRFRIQRPNQVRGGGRGCGGEYRTGGLRDLRGAGSQINTGLKPLINPTCSTTWAARNGRHHAMPCRAMPCHAIGSAAYVAAASLLYRRWWATSGRRRSSWTSTRRSRTGCGCTHARMPQPDGDDAAYITDGDACMHASMVNQRAPENESRASRPR